MLSDKESWPHVHGPLKLPLSRNPVCVCMFVCVLTPKVLRARDMMVHDLDSPNDWLNKFYNFFVAAVIVIVNTYTKMLCLVILSLKILSHTHRINQWYYGVEILSNAIILLKADCCRGILNQNKIDRMVYDNLSSSNFKKSMQILLKTVCNF